MNSDDSNKKSQNQKQVITININIPDWLWIGILSGVMMGVYLNFLVIGPSSIAVVSWVIRFVLGQVTP